MPQILSFFSPLSPLFSPTKTKSGGAQARHFSTKLSLIFQRLLTLCTQLPAHLQRVIRSGAQRGTLCSGAEKNKKQKKVASRVSVALLYKVRRDGCSRADKREARSDVPGGLMDVVRRATTRVKRNQCANRTAAQLLAWRARLVPKYVQCQGWIITSSTAVLVIGQ